MKFFVFLVLFYLGSSLMIPIGVELGVNSTSSISPQMLSKIIEGVEKKQKESIYYFGLLKLYGISYQKEEQEALNMFFEASKLGHLEAMTAYAVLKITLDESKTITVVENENEEIKSQSNSKDSVYWLRKASKLGDLNANWILARILLESQNQNEVNLKEAIELLQIASNNNIPQAQHILGIMYEYGRFGLKQNFQKALQLYQFASQQNYFESMYHLGLMHLFGRGISINLSMSLSLFEKCANENHAGCCYQMGILYFNGLGCEINYKKSLHWFEKTISLSSGNKNDFFEKASVASKEIKSLLELADQYKHKVVATFAQTNQIEH